MRNCLLRLLMVFFAMMLLTLQAPHAVAAANETEAHMQELARIAEQGHYRFMQMNGSGYDAAVAKDLLEKDRMILESEPTGSVKIIVKDSQNGDLIEGAQVILTTKRNRFSTVDGVKTQTANPFLAIDLGKTGKDGSALYSSPVFYHDVLERDGAPVTDKYIDRVSYGIGAVKEGAAVLIVKDEPPYSMEGNEGAAVKAVAGMKGKKMPVNDLIDLLKKTPGVDDWSRGLDRLFNSEMVAYSDDVLVDLRGVSATAKVIQKIAGNDKEIMLGALRTAVDANHPELDKNWTARHYRDFGGYTPSYLLNQDSPEENVVRYRDGTEITQVESGWIYLEPFGDVVADKGMAVEISGFTYRPYVYHPDYLSGESKSAYISQDLVDKDVVFTVYLSKDVLPVVGKDESASFFGRLTDKAGTPLTGATVTITELDVSRVTDADGYYYFYNVPDGTYSLSVKSGENGAKLETDANADGKTLSGAKGLVLKAGEVPKRVDLYQGTYAGKPKGTGAGDKTKATGNGSLPIVLLVALGAFLVVAVVILLAVANGKKKKKAFGHGTATRQYEPDMRMPGQNQQAPPYQQTPPYQQVPAYQQIPPIQAQPGQNVVPGMPMRPAQFCTNCGNQMAEGEMQCSLCGRVTCPSCGKTSEAGSSFCKNCGGRM